jgi:hypothetical protein
MTIKEIAKAVGMHRGSVARLAGQGKIPGLLRGDNGRFRVSDFTALQKWTADVAEAQRHRFRGVQSGLDPLKRIRCAIAFEKDPSRGKPHEATLRKLEEEERALLVGKVPEGETYSTADIARMLGLTSQSVRNRARKGRIPGVVKTGKTFRFERAKIDSYCADRSHYTKEPRSRRVSDAIGRLERAVMALQELSKGDGLTGHRPALQRVADKLNEVICSGSIPAVAKTKLNKI